MDDCADVICFFQRRFILFSLESRTLLVDGLWAVDLNLSVVDL